MELAKGTGMLFLNPLLYWAILLMILTGIRRIKKERNHFGTKVFPLFSEWKQPWATTFIFGFILSILCLAGGIVFSLETLVLISFVSIIFSIALRFTLLSPSYTLGFTFILLLLIPLVKDRQTFVKVDDELFTSINFSGISILLGIFLIVEALMIRGVRQNETFPELFKGKRGKWIGQHHVKKASLIPFFALVPSGSITSFVSFWPSVSLAGDSYSIVLIPFLIGFDFTVKGNGVQQAGKKVSAAVIILGGVTLVIAIGSVFVSWLALVAVVIAILGREYIRYRHQVRDQEKPPYFYASGKGLKILAVIPNSPADKLNIYAGETIYKVNNQRVQKVSDFYQALQGSGAFFKMEVIDDAGEVRFVQRAFYQGEHYELGVLFTKEKYRQTSDDSKNQRA